MADLKTMPVHSSDRGSLCLGDREALQSRSYVKMPVIWDGERYYTNTVSGKPDNDTLTEPVFPYSSRNRIDRTVNMIGKALFVDFGKGESGHGLTWEDAFGSLSDLLDDPFVYYTCAVQRQVVHVHTRGGVCSEAVHGRLDRDMQGYLVIHDAEFLFEHPKSVPIPNESSTPYFIHAPGVVFVDCAFTVRMPDGEDAAGRNEDNSGKPGGNSVWPASPPGGDDGEGGFDSVALCGNRIYFYRCQIHLYGGNGGNGSDGGFMERGEAEGYPTGFIEGMPGGDGGLSGGVSLVAYNWSFGVILDSCSVEIVTGSCGSGGDGGDGMEGGDGGDVYCRGEVCRLSALKIYDCDIKAVYRPRFHAGNGGRGEAFYNSRYEEWTNGYGGYGGVVHELGDGILIDATYIRGCRISKVVDFSGVSAGVGGAHDPFTRDSGYEHDGIHEIVTSYDFCGGGGNIGTHGYIELISCTEMIDSELRLEIPHLGTSRDLDVPIVSLISGYIGHLHNVKATLDMPMNAAYINDAHTDAGDLILGWVYPFNVSRAFWADTVDIDLHIGTPPSPPDGMLAQISSNPIPGHFEYLYNRGGDVQIESDGWLYVPETMNFPSKYGDGAEYGVRISATKPGKIKCGHPGGTLFEINGYGWIVDGADGRYNERDGGNATAAFTWWNWSAPAGTPGKGAPATEHHDAGKDGRLLPEDGFEITYPASRHISVTFV